MIDSIRTWLAVGVATLACTGFTGQAGAVLQSIEPDDFANGTIISNAYPGATLSEFDIFGGGVIGDVYSTTDDLVATRLGVPLQASTGDRVFGIRPILQFPNEAGDGDLRIDFDTPTNFVSVDFIGSNTGTAPNEIGIGRMLVYDASDTEIANLLAGPGDGLLFNEVETLTISRTTPDIAYIQLRRAGDNFVAVDNIQFNAVETVVPEPASLSMLALAAGLLGLRRRARA